MFSIFEPNSWAGLSANWVATGVTLLIPLTYWLRDNAFSMTIKLALKNLFNSFKANFKESMGPGSSLALISIFLVILVINLVSLLPYVFSVSSHLSFSLGLAFPLWVGPWVYSWMKNPVPMLAHLVPAGTPPFLMPFMVLIELVSSLIRPLTLSVRLAANMTAGHLLLSLIGSSGSFSSSGVVILLLMVCMVLLETAVAFIQSYVFSLLVVLYTAENSASVLA